MILKPAFALLFPAVIAANTCDAQKKPRVTYEFPPEMPDAVRSEYLKQWEKGKILYEMSCAKCHNTREKRREIIPDFRQEQLIGYELRAKNAQHDTGVAEERVSPEELGLIMTFLTYKKKN